MILIPAMDLMDGRCVRLTQGDYGRKTQYDASPLEMAKALEGAGLRHLHLVDLEGARAGTPRHLHVLEEIASSTSLAIDYGGGMRQTSDVEHALGAGARQVTAGSVAVQSPDLVGEWLHRWGNERIVLGADVRDGHVASHGWTETSGMPVERFVQEWMAKGMGTVICTDIAVDGTLRGPSLGLYARLLQPGLKLVASGGVRSVEDLLALRALGCHGAIIGKALYEGAIPLTSLTSLLIQTC